MVCQPDSSFAPHLRVERLRSVGPFAASGTFFARGEATKALTLIDGPPGTGKTTRLVESIREALHTHARILVCASTNVAVCNLYARLLDVADADVSLCMPADRVTADVATRVHAVTPSRRIVCATISSRAGPHLDALSFDAVFVDEAAQTCEALIWTLLRSDTRRLVLAGDVRQLRAQMACANARERHHDRSLMERLATVHQYPCERLLVQRRMPEALFSLPNALFYDSELRYAANLIHSSGEYQCVQVDGTCEPSGTSHVNRAESNAIKKIIADTDTSDTVVLCPYQAQARAILAHRLGVAVHTVDSFKGERANASYSPWYARDQTSTFGKTRGDSSWL